MVDTEEMEHVVLNKYCLIDGILSSQDHFLSLSLRFSRNLTDREALDVVRFLSILRYSFISLERRDSRFWSPDPSRRLSCWFYFHMLSLSSVPYPVSALSSI